MGADSAVELAPIILGKGPIERILPEQISPTPATASHACDASEHGLDRSRNPMTPIMAGQPLESTVSGHPFVFRDREQIAPLPDCAHGKCLRIVTMRPVRVGVPSEINDDQPPAGTQDPECFAQKASAV